MKIGTHPPKGRSLYGVLSFTILFAILLSLPAPASVSAQTSPVATVLTIIADSTVVGPDGKFTATVTTEAEAAISHWIRSVTSTHGFCD